MDDNLLDYGNYVKYHEQILKLFKDNISIFCLSNCFGGSTYTDENNEIINLCNCSGQNYELHKAKMMVNKDFIEKFCNKIKDIVGCEKVIYSSIYNIDRFVDEQGKLIIVLNNWSGEIEKRNKIFA